MTFTRGRLSDLQNKYRDNREVNEVINALWEFARALSEAQPGDASDANIDDDDDWWYGVWAEACELSEDD